MKSWSSRRAIESSPINPPPTPQIHPCPVGPDLHCSAQELAFKLEHGYASDPQTVVPPRLLGYRCGGLATAIFLGELLDHVATTRGAIEADFNAFADSAATELIGEEPLVLAVG